MKMRERKRRYYQQQSRCSWSSFVRWEVYRGFYHSWVYKTVMKELHAKT